MEKICVSDVLGTISKAINKRDTPLNRLSPNSDQHQISPCNINAYSTLKVMIIKDMITQGGFS